MLLPTIHKITTALTLSRTTSHLFIFHLIKTYQIPLFITYYHTTHNTTHSLSLSDSPLDSVTKVFVTSKSTTWFSMKLVILEVSISPKHTTTFQMSTTLFFFLVCFDESCQAMYWSSFKTTLHPAASTVFFKMIYIIKLTTSQSHLYKTATSDFKNSARKYSCSTLNSLGASMLFLNLWFHHVEALREKKRREEKKWEDLFLGSSSKLAKWCLLRTLL
jgi:hypothetical protein